MSPKREQIHPGNFETIWGYSYCWWTKSCTTKHDDYPIIHRVLTIPGGAGFCPSTVFLETPICFSFLTSPPGPVFKTPALSPPRFPDRSSPSSWIKCHAPSGSPLDTTAFCSGGIFWRTCFGLENNQNFVMKQHTFDLMVRNPKREKPVEVKVVFILWFTKGSIHLRWGQDFFYEQ